MRTLPRPALERTRSEFPPVHLVARSTVAATKLRTERIVPATNPSVAFVRPRALLASVAAIERSCCRCCTVDPHDRRPRTAVAVGRGDPAGRGRTPRGDA